MRKLDILKFTREDNKLFSHVKRSLLVWLHVHIHVKIAPFDAFGEMIYM